VFGREHHDVECGYGSTAHGVDVGYRVCGRDLTEPVGVVDRWRDEVDRTDDSEIVGQAVDRRIIGGLDTDQEVLIRRGLKAAKRARQIRRADLGRSTASASEPGEGFLFHKGHRCAP